ncbi:MAG: hypothetical protein GXC73_19880, partial [Chitinophagaceae bacterium]|nr:hypothetical protein [Chitinophagaceae bacterium]
MYLNSLSLFSFAHIEYLLLLVVVIPVVLFFVLNKRWKKKTKKKLGDEELVNLLTANHSEKKFAAKFYIILAAVVVTAIGAANLRTAGKAENVNRKGRDIMIALDVSKSMLADDIKPTRLDRAKQFVNK